MWKYYIFYVVQKKKKGKGKENQNEINLLQKEVRTGGWGRCVYVKWKSELKKKKNLTNFRMFYKFKMFVRERCHLFFFF